MYARCTITQGSPDIIDETVKTVREQVIPFGQGLDGFRGVIAFADRESGKGMTFTLWESEEARRASAEQANQVRDDMTRQLKSTVLGVEHYELVLEERAS